MLNSSAAYKSAITADSRRILLRAVVNIIDPDAAFQKPRSGGLMAFSRPEQLTDKETEQDVNYITLEPNRWLLGAGFTPVPASGVITGQVGTVNTTLSGADGRFRIPQWVEQPFTGVSILQACSVFFGGKDYDGTAADFTVDVMQGGRAVVSRDFSGNTARHVSVTGFTVYNPDAVRVTVRRWSLPGRRMRTAEIIPGIYEVWDGDMIAAFSTKQQGDVSCLSLPYGTCTITMDNADRRFEPRNKMGLFQSIEERQGIPVSVGVALEDGGTEYKQVGVYYQYSGGWKTGTNGLVMQWDLVDIVGLLAERIFIPPDTLPTTLKGWLAALVGQLGPNFKDLWHADPAYADAPLTCAAEDIQDATCGAILRWACMASGTWPRADASTGRLTAEPLWDQGGELTLDNLENYPTIKANNDLAALIFTLNDENGTRIVVSGNDATSNQTISVSNPFLHTQEQALAAARRILTAYGGSKLETIGRGDPSAEIGDVDTVWLDESSAATGRRIMQTLTMQGGVLRACRSTLLQADGYTLYQNRVVLTGNGTWTAPAGVSELRLILVERGEDGTDGTDGGWSYPGENGVDGRGGRVWYGTVGINPGQAFRYSTSGAVTTFGAYSTANGSRFPAGFTDVASGDSYARSGVRAPLDGSGDGGKGGVGGAKGNRRKEVVMEDTWLGTLPTTVTIVDNVPGKGTKGKPGASGCVVIYYDKEAEQ